MIPRDLSTAWAALAPGLANHLWQSTLFALAAGLLTLALRKNHARARYWLWFAASVKFLIPFSLLVSAGSHLAWPRPATVAQSGVYLVLEEASQPFTPRTSITALPDPAVVASPIPVSRSHLLLPVLSFAWLCGFVAVLCLWIVRWRRLARVCRAATPLREGREIEALRRLHRLAGRRRPVGIRLSQAAVEPGVFGVARPILLWPADMSERLENAHLEAIIAHELCHVRREDNLAALLHMAVEAIFWFHPLVWWLGARLVDERERACDEAVLESGQKPQVYAESVLKACEFCVGSPLACVAGMTGSDLKDRIIRIMTERVAVKLDLQKKLLLGAAALLAIGVPLVFGLAHGQDGTASSAGSTTGSTSGPAPKFEVASIKPDKTETPGRMLFRIMDPSNDGRFYATGPTLKMLIRIAYDVQDSQIVGGPSWMNSEHFDIQAKADDAVNAQLKKLSPDDGVALKHRMLQALLLDRFKLSIRHETRNLPVYALVVEKNGPKFQQSKEDDSATPPPGPPGPGGRGGRTLMLRANGGEQEMTFHDSPLTSFAEFVAQQLGRTVVDRTGLKGNYDFELKWTPDESQRHMFGGPGPGPGAGPVTATGSMDSNGPTIFTAIREQLGLKLESQTGPVDVLVIDSADKPSAD